jgi:hypothetical protein
MAECRDPATAALSRRPLTTTKLSCSERAVGAYVDHKAESPTRRTVRGDGKRARGPARDRVSFSETRPRSLSTLSLGRSPGASCDENTGAIVRGCGCSQRAALLRRTDRAPVAQRRPDFSAVAPRALRSGLLLPASPGPKEQCCSKRWAPRLMPVVRESRSPRRPSLAAPCRPRRARADQRDRGAGATRQRPTLRSPPRKRTGQPFPRQHATHEAPAGSGTRAGRNARCPRRPAAPSRNSPRWASGACWSAPVRS